MIDSLISIYARILLGYFIYTQFHNGQVLRLNICYVNYSAMLQDGSIEAMQNNTITIHGVLKPTTMNFLVTLWQCVFDKNISNPAVLQQPTNDVPEAKGHRFKWSLDKSKIFIDCVEELKKKDIGMFFIPLILSIIHLYCIRHTAKQKTIGDGF